MPASPIDVILPFSRNAHTGQVIVGFQMLEDQGLVRCRWRSARRIDSPILSVILNGRTRITYDCLDGFNWIKGSRSANLSHFENLQESPSWYFKRSFDWVLQERAPRGVRVQPLGLNYGLRPEAVTRIARLIDKSRAVKQSFLRKSVSRPTADAIARAPRVNGPDRVLLYTRLWSPESATVTHDETLMAERDSINRRRVLYVEALRDEFGTLATVGIVEDPYSSRHVPRGLLLAPSQSERGAYLHAMKEHSICVATSGLHGSIGWRLGEYVAASRGIVTEPLQYTPGPGFAAGVNYLHFSDTTSLIGSIRELLDHPTRLTEMMLANHDYYATRLRPDSLVLRTILIALELMPAEVPDTGTESI